MANNHNDIKVKISVFNKDEYELNNEIIPYETIITTITSNAKTKL